MTGFSRFSRALAQVRDQGRHIGYVFSDDMQAAIDLALGLGRPLLVTGEPGVGKTRLGHAVAGVLGLPPPHVFVTRSTSEARDVFYRYDALARFRDAQLARQDQPLPPPGAYLTFEALGLAILGAHDLSAVLPLAEGSGAALDRPAAGRQSVAIIDEIDKAPREVANDMLVEIETFRFSVPELAVIDAAGRRHSPPTPEIDAELRPLVFFTSNSERQLPDAFLRRCIFLEIVFPEGAALRRILETVIRQQAGGGGGGDTGTDRTLTQLVDLVGTLRARAAMAKPPSIAETLDALKVLTAPDGAPPEQRWQALHHVLAKQVADRRLIAPFLAGLQA